MTRTGDRRTIVFLIGALNGGGAERIFLTLLRHLDRNLFAPHLVLLQAEGELISEIPRDVVVHDLGGARDRRTLRGLVRLMRRLVRVLRQIGPAAVLSGGGMNLALVLARPFLPRGTRLLIRETSVLGARLVSDTRRPRLWGLIYRYLYRRADKVICQSDAMVEEMTGQFRVPRHQVVRIYNPVDFELVRDLGGRGGNPYTGRRPQLLAAGRLSHEKGFDLLLAAMPRIVESFPQARLTVLGCGPLERALMEQTRALGLTERVSFIGFEQNPWRYVRHADLLVVPSRREGFGNVLIEGLALGTPAVAADCPGAIREIYGDHPAVHLVPAEDPAALAATIIEKCRMLARAPTKSAAAAAWLAKFAVQKSADEYGAMLTGWISEQRRSG